MKLARVNTILLVAIILVNGYIIAMPWLPSLTFWWHSRGETRQVLDNKLHPLAAGPSEQQVTTENRLVIPAMLLDAPFHEGPDARTLNKGPWLRPNGSTPEKGSNTVIAAHRFTYTDPEGEFYHLDKLKPGDAIGLFKGGQKYLYTVREIKTVPADALAVEAPTDEPRLTLYTCTPLWLPRDRLVVVATPQTTNERYGQ